ncbi:hypothetical protein SAMN04487904_101268 [Actinopolyspora lacussalsi subsp. righensis]|uniref:Uncharacterized protein n=1 Tax=Actinopolyspora righensis TaxID=995060 RepID=A0A1I6X6Y2_9ACTN|nr:hypothetical protein SAMN04487904_101268 [Actinopolyspora righensis]
MKTLDVDDGLSRCVRRPEKGTPFGATAPRRPVTRKDPENRTGEMRVSWPVTEGHAVTGPCVSRSRSAGSHSGRLPLSASNRWISSGSRTTTCTVSPSAGGLRPSARTISRLPSTAVRP